MPSLRLPIPQITRHRLHFMWVWGIVCLLASGRLRAGELGIDPPDLLYVLGTGEIHAAPDPCDCPLNPVGGLSRLAGRIKAEVDLHPDRTVMIDTGAFVAGGPLDGRTAGAAADLDRSRWMVRFMGVAHYDAVALGDEELALGRGFFAAAADAQVSEQPAGSPYAPRLRRIPFTCANLDLPPEQRAALNIAEYIKVPTGAGNVWVVGLAPPGEYNAGVDRFVATDPIAAVRKVLAAAAQAEGDAVKIVLASHLGDTATFDLLDAITPKPGAGAQPATAPIVAVLAGHRRPAEVRHSIVNTPVMFVRGEGQYLARITLGAEAFPRLDELPIDATGPELPAAGDIADHIRALTRQARPQVDFTFATDCPHCTVAVEPTLETVAKFAGHIDFHLRFMVHRTADGGYRTGIQPGADAEQKSYEDTRRLLVVAKYAPADVWALLKWRKNNPTADFAEGLAVIHFPAWRLTRALEAGEDRELLDENVALTERRQVPGTPSVYVDNKLYDGPLQALPLQSGLCAHLRRRAGPTGEADLTAVCTGVPRCYQAGDCEKPGFIARCLDAGKPTAECQFIEDKEVTLYVVQETGALHSNAADLVGQLQKFFAKLKVEPVEADSALGRKLIAESGQTTLPLFAVKNLRDAVNQADVEKFGRYAGDDFILQPLPFYSHDHFTRKRTPGTLDLFYEVHSPNAAKAVLRLQATLDMLARQTPGKPAPLVRLHPLVYLKPADGGAEATPKLIARGGLGELEQSARLLAVAELYPDQALAYAALCAQAPGSTYWERPLKLLKLDPDAVAARAVTEPITAALRAEAALAQELRLDGDVAFLARNREVVPIQNGERLWQVLVQLQADREPSRPPDNPQPLPTGNFAPTFRGVRP